LLPEKLAWFINVCNMIGIFAMKNTKFLKCICIVYASTTLLTGCSSFTDGKGLGINYDRRTAGTIIDDKGLEIRANTLLTRDKELWENCHIKAISYNNAILLVGQSPSENLKERAAVILQRLVKKEHIYNQITIENPTPLTTRTQDTWITTQVKGKIVGNKDIGINRVKVVTENGIVFLIGILTRYEENLATQIASQTPNVKQVIKIISSHEPLNEE